jgi:hypothetical protein
MRYIAKKGPKTACPKWYTYTKSGNAKFRGNAQAKWQMRQALAREQGFLCAFCMGQLDCNINSKGLAKPHGESMTKIAHLISQHPVIPPNTIRNSFAPIFTQIQRDRLAVSYKNLVLACQGKGTTYRYKHCDLHQRSDDVTIDLFNRGKMREIRFLANGVIEVPDVAIQKQIGTPTSANDLDSVLNLNNPHLCSVRASVWDAVVDFVDNTSHSPIQLLRQWQAEAQNSPPARLRAYYEIGIYYLELHVKQR